MGAQKWQRSPGKRRVGEGFFWGVGGSPFSISRLFEARQVTKTSRPVLIVIGVLVCIESVPEMKLDIS
jgi:hypothetical protein